MMSDTTLRPGDSPSRGVRTRFQISTLSDKDKAKLDKSECNTRLTYVHRKCVMDGIEAVGTTIRFMRILRLTQRYDSSEIETGLSGLTSAIASILTQEEGD